jgi:hypothetical protein
MKEISFRAATEGDLPQIVAMLADDELVQLTTDKSRPDALRFYESLGFVASHEGMNLSL